MNRLKMTSKNISCQNHKLSIHLSDSTESLLRINQKDDINIEDDDDYDELSSSFCSIETSVCDKKVDADDNNNKNCRMKRCSEAFFDAFPFTDNHDKVCREDESDRYEGSDDDNDGENDEDDDIEDHYVDDDDVDDVDDDDRREESKPNIYTCSESDDTTDYVNEQEEVKESASSKLHH